MNSMRPYQVGVLMIIFRGFNLSTDTLEAGLRFLLHLVIEACLEGWWISHSQMAPNSWRYLVAFSWECHGSGIVATRELFTACFHLRVKDMNEAWLAEAGLSPTTREIFNLRKMKSSDGMGRGSVAPSAIDASASTVAADSMVEKYPDVDEVSSLRKCSRRVTPEQPANTSGSTTRVPAKKGKELMILRRPPSGGIPSESYARWRIEQGRGALHPILAKQVNECSSEELMDQAGKSSIWLESLKNQRWELEQEVGVLRSNLDGARNDRAHLEGDVLSLTEAAALLEAELKAEGPKVVVAYKASRGFELGLEKMG
ncbi:hypothetical protein BHM03_00033681 [Ensete ventricosum]|nr:hypothetical protein BHM03_00033681 [Ensete ventricosum]